MTEPTRPARPDKSDARRYNAHLGSQIEDRLQKARALLEEAAALASDVVGDVDDIAKDIIGDAAGAVKRFLNSLDLVKQTAESRKQRLAAKVAAAKAPAFVPVPPPTPAE